uniref:Uncharacterized protein n=1 Tax=Arundo donax TaxID=35708 RepID=A0A0A8Z562_ARUDO
MDGSSRMASTRCGMRRGDTGRCRHRCVDGARRQAHSRAAARRGNALSWCWCLAPERVQSEWAATQASLRSGNRAWSGPREGACKRAGGGYGWRFS